MKKIIASFVTFTFILLGNAHAVGFKVGGSITAGVFEVDGATERNEDATINSASEGDEAEGLFGIGSIFTEVSFTDNISIGLDYVPHTLESNQVSNEKEVLAGSGKTVGTNVTNIAEVHIEEIVTAYASLYLNENVYAKAGIIQADVITVETLGTGGAYPNTDMDGIVVGIGYDKSLDNGLFFRLEANYTEFDSVKVTNSVDSTKSITVDGVEGYGAKLSIGKTF